jgi:uncharacterized protein YecE (DUF72 family)
MSHSGSPFAHISAGCAELPPGMSRAAYFQKLPLLEMRLPGERMPAASMARRWATDAGGPGRIVLVAPRELCRFHRADGFAGLDQAATDLAAAATEALAAAVLFMTPPDLSPSSAHRDALQRFFGEIATAERFGGDGGAARVWQPDGLWRPLTAATVAGELGVVAAVDPLAPDPLEEGLPDAPAEIAYARVTGLGRPSRPLGADDLAELAEWAAPSRRAFIVFATPTRFKDAVAMARALG